MLTLIGNTIYITKGDTLDLQVAIQNQDGEEYTPSENDRIRFAMKKKYTDLEPMIVKEISPDTLRLRIEAEETKRWKTSPTPYVYDIEITFEDGTVDTFIERQKLYVTEEVY